MRAIILAAGRSTRMSQVTGGHPKCLLRIGGRTLLERNVASLKTLDLSEIVLVRGENRDLPIHGCTPIDGVPAGNMVSSLMLARDRFDQDLIIVYADVVYDPEVLQALARASGDFVVPVDTKWQRVFAHRSEDVFSEAESCRYDDEFVLREIGKTPATPYNTQAQFIGLIRCSPAGLRKISCLWDGHGATEPMAPGTSSTELLQQLIEAGERVRALPVEGGWFEFDSPVDYQRAMQLRTHASFRFMGEVL